MRAPWNASKVETFKVEHFNGGRRDWPDHMILPPKEYAQQVEDVKKRMQPLWREDGRSSGPGDPSEDRMARNTLSSRKVFERADYGRLADVRELVALRIAPWLIAERRLGHR